MSYYFYKLGACYQLAFFQNWKNKCWARSTSKSSWLFMNSASVAEESQFKLYSLAISFKTLSLVSPDGLAGESFSIICSENRNNPTS